MELIKKLRKGGNVIFSFLLITIVVGFSWTTIAKASVSKEGLVTCQPFSERRILAAVLEAADLVGIDHIPLLGVLVVETGFGRNLGKPNEILSAKPNRDVVPLIALARAQGLSPFTVCASKRQKVGYGGALGPAQVLPSIFLHYAGLVVKDKHHYKQMGKKTDRLSGGDVVLLQRILNRIYPRHSPLVEDGIVGRETLKRVRHFQHSYMNEESDYQQGDRCLTEIRKGYLGSCTRVALLDKVRWVLEPDPEKTDRLTPLLGGSGTEVPNPWDPRTSLLVSALLLKDLGVQENPDEALGAYFAGPSRAFSESGVSYASKVKEAMREAPNFFIHALVGDE